ncbi:hypothetical protein [Reichenbachiella sp. MALMAid0571]|uniref:hypothetical protein n=1 Tax=Reichenbachiella sp. MALMAid0571 TaxID=3143939 RepID=UPI0032DEF457
MSQAPDDTISKIREVHKNIKKARIVTISKTFVDEYAKTALQSDTSFMWIDGQKSKVVAGDIEMIVNEKCMVVVNHNIKLIQYQKRLDDFDATNSNPSKNIDSLLSQSNLPVLQGKKNGLIHYRLKQKEALYEFVDIYFDSNTYLIRQLDVQYNAERLGSSVISKVSYPVFEINPLHEKEMFDERRYLRIEEGELKPEKDFSEYRVSKSEVFVLN